MKILLASAAILVSLNAVAHAYDESRSAWWRQDNRVPNYYAPPSYYAPPPPPVYYEPPPPPRPISLAKPAPVKQTVTPDTTSASYIKGSNDRDAWERWYNGLEGFMHTGAEYWANSRNKNPISCEDMHSDSASWTSGCVEARKFLAPVDRLRKSDAQYWNGWNKKAPFVPAGIPGETPEAISASSKPAVSTLSKEERDTNSCVRETRGQVGQFDAYYDPARNAWNTLGVKNGTFYFGKCMTERGHSIKFKDE